MINLEETFIRGVGLTELPRGARRQLLAKVTDELETRVGTRLAVGLTEEELDEFERIMPDEDAAAAWLDEHVPDRSPVITAVIEEIVSELTDRRADILAAHGVPA